MGKTILYIAMSLDGYIAGPKEDLSWLDSGESTEVVDEQTKDNNPYEWEPFFSSVGALIVGRNTYDLEVRNGWADSHPVPKFVLSSKPKHPKAKKDDFFTDEDIEQVLQKAKKITDKNIWVEGGAHVAQQFIERDLLDEMILFIAPVLLGDGVKLFGDLDVYKHYKLRKVRKSGGMVQLEYIRSKSEHEGR